MRHSARFEPELGHLVIGFAALQAARWGEALSLRRAAVLRLNVGIYSDAWFTAPPSLSLHCFSTLFL